MSRTFIRQDAQIGSTRDTLVGYLDNQALAAALESGAVTVADDLNALRSVLHQHKSLQGGNWYDDLVVPAQFPGEGAAQRAIDGLNSDLYDIERKRFLRRVRNAADVTVGTGDNYVILGAGELPSNTTGAVGLVSTLGTVVADESGGFGAHSLAEVGGNSPLNPRNLVDIVDGTTGDQITSGGLTVYGLLQSEFSADGTTITATTPNRVQISFVRANAAFDDLEAVPVADIENAVINYTARERIGFEDLNEQDLLSDTIVDAPTGVTVTRQISYDNQGATPVDVTTNAILDLEGAGLEWQIRDDLEAVLLRVIEGSAGGTSEVEIAADVDLYDNNAADVDFASGATLNSGGTRPIDVGVTDGRIEATAGDLEMASAAGELFLDDSNQPVSWAQTAGIKLSEQATDWSTWETNFGGEVSLLEGINSTWSLANAGGTRTRVQANLTSNVTAGSDVNGPGTPHSNTDVNLAPFDQVSFVSDVFVYLNGELLRTTDEVSAGGTPADGDLQFAFNLRGVGGNPDGLIVVVFGQ